MLVIEDSRSLVANLFDYFESRGYTLDAARTGSPACTWPRPRSMDAIVLDWMLPRMDGCEVLRRCATDTAPTCG